MHGTGSAAGGMYAVLTVRPPGDRLSGVARSSVIAVVALNTLALTLPFWDVSESMRLAAIGAIETLSTAFFIAEYALRLWSAPAEPGFRGRLRFALRPLSLVDLAATLPTFVAALAGSPEAALDALRVGWIVRHLKLLRYLGIRPLLHGAEPLVQPVLERLAEIRHRLTETRESDFARVQQLVRAAVRRAVDAARLPGAGGTSASAAVDRPQPSAAELATIVEQLEAELTASDQVRPPAELLAGAYRESATIFDDAPTTSLVEVALDGVPIGRKSVPLAGIGRHHFVALSQQGARLAEAKDALYVPDVRRALAQVRAAMVDAFRVDGAAERGVALNRAIDLLRDVNAPVRLTWDALLYDLEEQHRRRLQLVREDVERHGHPAFYAKRAARWLGRRLNATLHVREATARIWSLLSRFLRDVTSSLSRVVRQALLHLGVLRPPMHEMLLALEEARIESVRERGLPSEYLAHFDVGEAKDDGAAIGFEDELLQIRSAVERWQRRQPSSFIIHGHRGVGKTTLLHLARNQIFPGEPVSLEVLTQKLTSTDDLIAHLAGRLGLGGCVAADRLAEALIAGPRRVIFVDDAHNLFFRRIGGLDAVRTLFWLIAKTTPHLLWGVSLDTCAYQLMGQIHPLGELFHVDVDLDRRSSDELRRLIMTRHQRSGVSLHYVRDKRNEKAFRRRLKSLRQRNRLAQAHPQEALELLFFDALAAASAGNVLVAVYYWLRSLRVADEDLFRVEPFEALDLSLIWDFTENQAFILVALLQHGTLTTAELAEVLDTDRIPLRLDLEILTNLNVLESPPATDVFRVNPVVHKTVSAVLRARNLLR